MRPKPLGAAAVIRQNLQQRLRSKRRESDVVSAPVGGHIGPLDELAFFEPIHQAGDVGPVSEEQAAQLGLRKALRVKVQKV
jgi:hypothetical protein